MLSDMNDAMPDRLVIISDIHLGRPRCSAGSAEALRRLWAGASHLIVNGDAAEVHHPQFRATAARQLLALQDLCEADGVALSLISGNHDPYLTDLRHLYLADGQVLVTHGDALHPAITPWSPAAGRLRAAVTKAMAAVDRESHDHLETRLAAFQYASGAEWAGMLEREADRSRVISMFVRPWSMVRVLHYWSIIPHRAAEFLERFAPAARFIILGHTHRSGIWHINDRCIINTGSFGFPGRPQMVVVEGQTMTVRPIRWRRKGWSFAARPVATFQLQADVTPETPAAC